MTGRNSREYIEFLANVQRHGADLNTTEFRETFPRYFPLYLEAHNQEPMHAYSRESGEWGIWHLELTTHGKVHLMEHRKRFDL